jgi:hypothetical protein
LEPGGAFVFPKPRKGSRNHGRKNVPGSKKSTGEMRSALSAFGVFFLRVRICLFVFCRFLVKNGAADPCPFLARGREAPDGGTRGDVPQCFRARLPPRPIWPETHFEESCLSRL